MPSCARARCALFRLAAQIPQVLQGDQVRLRIEPLEEQVIERFASAALPILAYQVMNVVAGGVVTTLCHPLLQIGLQFIWKRNVEDYLAHGRLVLLASRTSLAGPMSVNRR
jgi:hypothetical protein